MKFLALETSTLETVIAVGDEKRLLAGITRRLERGRGERVPGLITACLKRARLSLKDVDLFGVGVGPGSFTGLRVGLSLIKGLSYSLAKPIVPFSSLDAIALNKPCPKSQSCAVIVDARRSNVYCRFYRGDIASSAPSMMPADKFFKKLPKDIVLRGDALAVYSDKASNKKLWYPAPLSVAACVRRELDNGNTTDCFGLDAVYLYESDCQVKKKG